VFRAQRPFHYLLGTFCLALGLVIVCRTGMAATYYWGQHPDKDRLVLRFESSMPEFSLERTGPQRLMLRAENGLQALQPENNGQNLADSRFIAGLDKQSGRVAIRTRQRAFGFVHFTLPAQNKLVIDFFEDANGRQWDESQPESETKPPAEPTSAEAQKKAQSPKDPPAAPSPSRTAGDATRPEPAAKGPASKAAPASEASASRPPASPEPAVSHAKSGQPPVALADQAKPGHVVRSSISAHGPLRAEPIETKGPGPRDSREAKGSEHSVRAPITANASQARAEGSESSSNASARNASAEANSTGNEHRTATPPEPEKLLSNGTKALEAQNVAEAARHLSRLANLETVPEEVREKGLHALAESLYRLYQGAFDTHYEELTGAFQEAINCNPDSPKVPRALYRLFMINLKTGNLPEARGYFNVLASEHPEHRFVPAAGLQLGEYALQNGRHEKAIERFQAIIDNRPDSEACIQAHFGLIRAYSEMEFYDKAWSNVAEVEKRWPDYRKRNPEFLNVAGFVALQTDRLQKAKTYFWRYYNLRPDAPEADFVLTRLGDIYLRQGYEGEATVMYHKAISRFPEQEGALVAKMRLAEEGIYDNPRLKNMPSYSEDSSIYSPREVYNQIISEHPQSPLAPLAQVKLAMWYLWKDRPGKSLQQVRRFEKSYPNSDLRSRSRKVGRKALTVLIQEAVSDQSHSEILALWDRHGFLHESPGSFAAKTLLSVATAMWKKDRIDQALDLASRFLTPDSQADTYATALKLSLNIHLDNQSWPRIIKLAEQADRGKLPEPLSSQLSYAQALAYEKMDQPDQGAPLWRQLATSDSLSGQQRAFAYYFLAKDSLKRDRLEAVYSQAQNALSLLMQQNDTDNRAKILDCLDMLINVTRRSGRTMEALQWAKKFQEHISPSAEEWPAHRYRLAEIYGRLGDRAKWRQILQRLSSTHPQSQFGQMAASDIDSQSLRNRAEALLQR
jgi:TolA-binding protein